MPRITHFFKTFFPDTQGGLEEAIRQIGKSSLNHGYDVRVVTQSNTPQKKYIDGIEVLSYKKIFGSNSAPFSYNLIKYFRSLIKETDIVQLHFPSTQEEIIMALTKINKPLIITFHCDIFKWPFLRRLYLPFAKRVLKKADYIIPTSENLINSTKLINRFKNKSKVINLWLDETRFDNLKEPEEEFKRKVESFGNFALFVGVLRWYKGLHILIEAAKTIKDNVVIVGKGPLFDKLKAKVDKENIKNIYLLGFQNDNKVKYLLQKCRFFVLPSISPAEAFGQVLLEASYLSKPMISTQLGTGTSYVNKDNETGYVVEPDNVEQLRDMMNILFTDDDKVRKFGENAYHRYKENFVEKVQGLKYINLYNSLLR
jgi:rhamnosyl/mannosyltransferase